MPNQTIDYGNLGSFFIAKRFPGIQDLKTKAEPGFRMFYDVALTGSLNGASQMKDFASAVKNPSASFKERFANDTLFYEQTLEYITVGGTVNGPGAKSISNTPQDRHATARWRFNKKETPCAIATDQWKASQNGSKTAKQKVNGAMNLISQEAAGAVKSQATEISTNMYSSNTDEANGIIGLRAGIGDSASDTTTYGGLSRSSIPAWVGNYTTASLSDLADPLSSSFLLDKLGDMIDTITDNGAMEEDLAILASTTVFKAYRQITNAQPSDATGWRPHGGQFNTDKGRGFSYSNLYYSGIPVIRDQRIPSGRAFIVDTATTFMVGLGNALFDMADWQLSENVTQHFARLTTISNIVVTHPRRNYQLYAS